ncbi:glycosyltransferase family 2 protein [Sedimentitalea sp. XS_ASV28]|uniref:glycosyltransferase family 2 protein n=1 Tax=Sedimentitalea sp. XS_ASV28 TaxID=3241296 RepID=UPI0035161BB6
MGAAPTISVITVTWNLIDAGRRDAILEVMDCVQGQSARGLEHVIWDGASTDGTQALIEEKISTLQQDGAPVPVRFFSEPDSGLYDAMNKAVAASSGDYIIFLNSDDLIERADSLALVQQKLASDDPDYAFGQTTYVNTDGSTFHARRVTTNSMLRSIPFCHNSTLIRRKVFLEMGGHDLQFRIVADYDMTLRIFLRGLRGCAMLVPIAVFRRGGLSADLMGTGAEVARVWRKNYAPFVDMSRYSDEQCLNWVRIGQLPLRVSWGIFRGNLDKPAVRRAARHSFVKTLLRRMQPWRSWDNLSA